MRFNRSASFGLSASGGSALTVNTGLSVENIFSYTVSAPLVLAGSNTVGSLLTPAQAANGLNVVQTGGAFSSSGLVTLSGLITQAPGPDRTLVFGPPSGGTIGSVATLTNPNNSYAGGTVVRRGLLSVPGSVGGGGVSYLGLGPLYLGDALSPTNSAAMQFAVSGGSAVTFGRDVFASQAPANGTSQDGRYQLIQSSGVTGATPTMWSGNITFGSASTTNTGNRRRLDLSNASLTTPLHFTGVIDDRSSQFTDDRVGGLVTINPSTTGGGVVRLANPANAFNGQSGTAVAVAAGTLLVGNNVGDGAATSPLGGGDLSRVIALADRSRRFENFDFPGQYDRTTANTLPALLLDGPFSLNRTVRLATVGNINNTSGGSSLAYLIGGTTAEASAFRGPITPELAVALASAGGTITDALDKRLRITAAAGGVVRFENLAGIGSAGGTSFGVTSVFKEGPGRVIFLSSHAYEGPTEVRNGTLELRADAPSGSAGTLGNATSAVVLGSTAVPTLRSGTTIPNAGVYLTQPTDQLALVTFGANMSVYRDIVVGNAGGGTRIGSDGGISTYYGTVGLNKGVTLSAAGGPTFFYGTISTQSGSTPVTVSGPDSVIFAANNTYTGGTTVQSGATLGLGFGTANGGLAGDVVNQGTLAFARSTPHTFGGAVSGAGTVTVQFGDVTLTAANSYLGGTTVSGGTLTVSGQTVGQSGVGTGPVSVTGGVLGGTGRVGGVVTVSPGGTLRGDSGAGTGVLAVDASATVVGAATNGGRLATQLATSGGTISTASYVGLSGGATTLNLDSTAGRFAVVLQNDAGLNQNQGYTVTLATAAAGSNFLRNGSAWNAGTNPFTTADFEVVSGSGTRTFTGVTLSVSGTNLQLGFTPVPEPAAVLGLAVAGLLVMCRRSRLGW